MATLNDVAKLAGVSPATVSRVLNHSLVVSENTRERVLSAVRELDYILPPASHPVSDKIVLVVTDISSPERSQALYRAIAAIGYQMLQFYYCEGPNTEQDLLCFLQASHSPKIHGILLDNFIRPVGAALLHELNQYPVVQLSGQCQLEHFISVDTDSFFSGYDATRLLLERGCRRIALLHSSGSFNQMDLQRLNGYQAALSAGGVVFDPELVIDIDFFAESSHEQLQRFLSRSSQVPDAFICPLDFLAITCLQVLTKAGFRIPEQVRIISLSDSWICQYTIPSITAHLYPREAICSEAVRLLHRLMKGEEIPNQHISFAGSFSMRNSTE